MLKARARAYPAIVPGMYLSGSSSLLHTHTWLQSGHFHFAPTYPGGSHGWSVVASMPFPLSWPTLRSNRCQDEESGALTFPRQARQISQTSAGPARPHRNGRLAGRSPGMIHEKPHRSSHPTVRESLQSGPAPHQTSVDSVSEDLGSSLLHSCGMHQALSPLRVYFVGHYMALSAPGAVGHATVPDTRELGRSGVGR